MTKLCTLEMSPVRTKSMQCYISTTVMQKALSDWKVTIAAYWPHYNHTTVGTEVRFVSGGKQQKHDMVKLQGQQETLRPPHCATAKLGSKAIARLSLT